MKIDVRRQILFITTLLLCSIVCAKGIAPQNLSKTAFYNAMSSNDMATIDDEISILQNSSSGEKEGYEGALLMKKAGLTKGPKKKLDLFKAGRIKLESAIMADKENTEYRFLRLAIEERAPKIVKYYADIEADKVMVEKNFKNLSQTTQKAILDYCKTSKVLHSEDFSSR